MKPSNPQFRFDKAAKDAEPARNGVTLSPAHHSGGFGAPDISSSGWQREREQILHRACQSIQKRITNGQASYRAFRSVARHLNGHPYKCDPKRRLALAESTLRAHYRKWKQGGEVPTAFRLHYCPSWPVFTAPLLIRFVQFFVNHPQSSMREAWRNFSRRGGNAGIGRRANRPLEISYGELRHNFPAENFLQVRAYQDVIESAQKNLAVLRQKLIGEISVRFPARPPRQRVRREIDFQI